MAGEICPKQVVFVHRAIVSARPGHALDGQTPSLDKAPGFLYIFHHETAVQNGLSGRAPQSPEKRFPIN